MFALVVTENRCKVMKKKQSRQACGASKWTGSPLNQQPTPSSTAVYISSLPSEKVNAEEPPALIF